ncbi:22787_t:CDS:2 [Dentiscutata erythropus]|uniref:22787_t:CDS:1 n=1 Tax=Dentiscutata erythropus TaxID=1348616 RepID=A0A9N8YVQ7_9GLOM|nr:22787_t:CDS:2 [Dentiscutata erythropus]
MLQESFTATEVTKSTSSITEVIDFTSTATKVTESTSNLVPTINQPFTNIYTQDDCFWPLEKRSKADLLL